MKNIRRISLIISLVILVWWSVKGTRVNLVTFIEGIPNIIEYFSRMFPPDLEYLLTLWGPVIQTLQIAIWGTILAVILATPMSFLAAKNISQNVIIFQFFRVLLNSLRSISEVVLALIFVSAVGLGPFPGVLALAAHTTGMLGKFYAEAIEGVDPGPIEALQAAGANKIQTIMYAIMPQVLPQIIAYNLFRFELCIRAATILGIVGAGGIGWNLIVSIKLFQSARTASVIIVILILVTVVDLLSTKLRAKIY
jgi:phosphonate transport system permease protein